MRALVTGGAGFIGSNLADALTARGAEVLVVDNLSTGHRENLDEALESGAALVEGDVAVGPEFDEIVDDFGPDRIFHLAAQVDVRKAVADPGLDARINVVGTINVLEAARRHDAAVVFASTGGAIYGEGSGRGLPLDEEAASLPETPYGASKLTGEIYLDLYRRLYGLAGVALRFGNVYGPRQDPHGEAGVVAIFCGLLRTGGPLRVFGDGEQTRDYVYVADVVAACLAAEEALSSRGSGGQRALTTSAPASRRASSSSPACWERRPASTRTSSTIPLAPARSIASRSTPRRPAAISAGWRRPTSSRGSPAPQPRSPATAERSLRQIELELGQVRGDRVALGSAVQRMAGGEHEAIPAAVFHDLRVGRVDDLRLRDLV